MDPILVPRHIQDHNEANTTLVKYWGYAERVLPCTKDAGTCEYLDAVYWMHDVSMLYTFILWGMILGILAVWGVLRFRGMGIRSQGRGGAVDELCWWVGGIWGRVKRRYLLRLLRDAPCRMIFGRVSRVQVLVLVVLLGYLAVFSLVGIVYKTWITPIKGTLLFNTRTGLGGWSDRIGALAYALTPLAVLLCQRESILSLIIGIPYQHFNFLHRWLGRIIFVQSFLHTLAWTLVEGKFYQPQPSTYATFMAQQYIVFGVVAMFLITCLTLFSTQWAIQKMGYEVFKISHWIIAVLYIGACWGHWDKLYCWMVPSLALIVIDQAVRFARTGYIHYYGGNDKKSGFRSFQARQRVLTDDNGTVIRLDLDSPDYREFWTAGQHFYVTFPSISIWQSHPFTVSSLPLHHTYLIRVRDGLTKKLAALGDTDNLPVILSGPYGGEHPSYDSQHILAVAGGTGVTFTLPIIQAATRQFVKKDQAVLDFVWVVRKSDDLRWLARELSELKEELDQFLGLRIQIFVSREMREKDAASSSSSCDEKDGHADPSPDRRIKGKEKADAIRTSETSLSSQDGVSIDDLLRSRHPRFRISFLEDHHPSVADIVTDSRERSMALGGGGSIEILGSGPEAMGSDLRAAVAEIRDAGDDNDVRFYWDSRE